LACSDQLTQTGYRNAPIVVEFYMEHHSSSRHLAAILAADIEGYTRLMSQDEGTTLARLTIYRQLISKLVRDQGGRIFGAFADSAMAEFPSAINAVRAAVAVQRVLEQQNAPLEEERRMRFRIGINVGEVLTEGENLYGDAVNIAARLQEVAAASGICVTGAVVDHIRGRTEVAIESLGERSLKNVASPVHIYRLDWRVGRPEETSLAGAMPALPDKPSIAVLPFVNMSGDLEQDYFSDGITEDIITALSKLRWFFVVARNSSFAYRGTGADVRQVARDLGVRVPLAASGPFWCYGAVCS
jgi:adenylate cyclase